MKKKKPGRTGFVLPQKDVQIPKETPIFYSKQKNLVQMWLVVAFTFMFFGAIAISKGKGNLSGLLILALLIGGGCAFKEYREATNAAPQIIISNKGIWTVNIGFKDWGQIENERIEAILKSDIRKAFLTYQFQDGNQILEIGDFDVEVWQLETLLRVYRNRYLTKTKKMKN